MAIKRLCSTPARAAPTDGLCSELLSDTKLFSVCFCSVNEFQRRSPKPFFSTQKLGQLAATLLHRALASLKALAFPCGSHTQFVEAVERSSLSRRRNQNATSPGTSRDPFLHRTRLLLSPVLTRGVGRAPRGDLWSTRRSLGGGAFTHMGWLGGDTQKSNTRSECE
jgi:hypothetical protein